MKYMICICFSSFWMCFRRFVVNFNVFTLCWMCFRRFVVNFNEFKLICRILVPFIMDLFCFGGVCIVFHSFVTIFSLNASFLHEFVAFLFGLIDFASFSNEMGPFETVWEWFCFDFHICSFVYSYSIYNL